MRKRQYLFLVNGEGHQYYMINRKSDILRVKFVLYMNKMEL